MLKFIFKPKFKQVTLFLFLLSVLFVFPLIKNQALSYDTNIAHPYLTEKTIAVFNKNSQTQITQEEKQWIIKGSIDEDSSFRYMNHFYNPNTGKGLKFMGVQYESAKDWAEDGIRQLNYDSKNHAWKAAMNYYVQDNKKDAFIALGHLLHLVEDMAVPAHTRLDAHPEGDSYENWARDFGNTDFVDINTTKPFVFDKLGDFFDKLAEYSNKYFLSKDTVSTSDVKDKKIFTKNIGGENIRCIEGKADQQQFCLIEFKVKKSGGIEFLLSKPVHSDYHALLAPKAVSYGAGLIDLFLKEANKEAERIKKEKEEETLWDRLRGTLNEDVSSQAMFASVGSLSGDFGVQNEGDNDVAQDSQTGFVAEDSATDNPVSPSDSVPAIEPSATETNPEIALQQQEQTPPSQQITLGVIYPNYSILSSIGPGGGGGGGGNSEQTENQDNYTDEAEDQTDVALEVLGCIDSTASNYNSLANTDDGSCFYLDITPPNAPIIISPADFLQTFATTTIGFVGTAETSSANGTSTIISAVYLFDTATTTATTSVSVEGSWSFSSLIFNEGTTTVQFFAVDQAGNISSSTDIVLFIQLPVPVEPDIIAPDVSLSVSECSSSISSDVNVCLITANTLNISWSSTSTDLLYFTIDQSGTVSTTTATSATIIVSASEATPYDSLYTFAISAVDTSGNVSATSTKIIEISTMPVVINEIAWMGTLAYSQDEWIELYNRTNYDIVFSDNLWKLISSDNSPNITLSGVIPAKGYYLLERTDDTTISDIASDLIYTGALNDSGEILRLSYGVSTIDSNVASSTGGWIAGNKDQKKTMERVSADISGLDISNWDTNYGNIKNGFDAGDRDGEDWEEYWEPYPIYGTPKARNDASYTDDERGMCNEQTGLNCFGED